MTAVGSGHAFALTLNMLSMAKKIRVGITHGDINGISYEIILKALGNEEITELLTPVIFGSEKALQYYRKRFGMEDFRCRSISTAAEAADGHVNLMDVCGPDIHIDTGTATREAGQGAFAALEAAVKALQEGQIDVLVTAPINKNTIHSDDFNFPGHTEYLQERLGHDGQRSLMILFNDTVRVALVTTHVPVAEIAQHITARSVSDTVKALDASLRRDFRCERPRIAVLALNPHCGDNGVIGSEDETIIRPTLESLRKEGILAFGPYAVDGFFGSGNYARFDGVVAMYHDQGLGPFKTLAATDGVNYTAGLDYVRTSPDHGTGYDIAGRGEADETSMRQAIYRAIDIFRARRDFDFARRNPLRPLPERDAKKEEKKEEKLRFKENDKKAGKEPAVPEAEKDIDKE